MIPTVFSCLRYSRASWSTSVLLPEPGAPVRPMMRACPLKGNSAFSSSVDSGAEFSIALMARASERTSPERTRSTQLLVSDFKIELRRSLLIQAALLQSYFFRVKDKSIPCLYRIGAGYVVLHHGFAQQVRRQQALRQDEVVVFLLVEMCAQGFFHVGAQLAQARVSVEIRGRLPGRA